MGATIGTGEGRGPEGPEDVAAEYLAATDAGEVVDDDAFLARLEGAPARAEFRELVDAARAAARRLPRALAPGTLVRARYRILSEIGSGGMGRVFAAYDETLERKVAVKMLTALHAGDPGREALFEREWRTLAALSHPGIVAVHEAGRDGDLSFLVMDFVDGTSLSDVIDRARKELARTGTARPSHGALLEHAIGKRVPPGRESIIVPGDWCRSVARIVLELARTLEAAHGAQVIHRDLKPSNVMLLGGGAPVVLDFGLAGNIEALAKGAVTRGLYGSLAYLAPEQVRTQQAGVDPRTDVYQLGLILHEMLTLRRTFPDGMADLLTKIQNGELVSPRKRNPDVPRDLDAICMMALELEPAQRYAGAAELRADLECFLGGRDVPRARKGSGMRALARRARATFRRHPMLLGAAGITAVALSIVPLVSNQGIAQSSPFLSYDQQTGEIRDLPAEGGSIVRGKWLAFRFQRPHASYMWALSVYGDGDERLVAPWRAASAEDIDRIDSNFAASSAAKAGESSRDPWQLEVPPGRCRILCARTAVKNPSEYEGLVVLESAVPRPELERWMDVLEELSLSELYSRGVPIEMARDQLAKVLEVKRGLGRDEDVSFTDADRARIANDLRGTGTFPQRLFVDLPSVEEYQIECRVVAPD